MDLRYKVTLRIKAPILTQASGSIGFGLDTATLRDNKERPVLTGSLIRGNIRHAWQDLQDITGMPYQSDIDKWLGTPADGKEQKPQRAALVFSEHWVDESWGSRDKIGKRFRIAIDESTGAVKTGALQVIESPYQVGEEPQFTGYIYAVVPSDKAKDLKVWLERALQLIPALGALKTTGFGKLLEASVEECNPQKVDASSSVKPTAGLSDLTMLGLRIKPASPFCFAKPAIGENNHFEAEQHIPAAAIVAAIADRIGHDKNLFGTLNKHLSSLHFTHARPVQTGANKRPIDLPLTLVCCNSRFHEITNAEAILISGKAPAFITDWKEEQFTQARQLINPLPNPESSAAPAVQLNIRTAIRRETGTAEDQHLFSMETVIPDGFDWLSNVSLGKIPASQREEVADQLITLFQRPLCRLGKTKVQATGLLEKAYQYTVPEQPVNTKKLTIYLQSPARLLPTGFQSTGTNSGELLHTAYQEAWNELSNNSLTLDCFFAHQKLEGGDHWWKRFRRQEKGYHPEIFTREGSVFIFDISDPEKAHPLINEWRQQGLPQLKNTPGAEYWEDNPWIAANGYGEIATNLVLDGRLHSE